MCAFAYSVVDELAVRCVLFFFFQAEDGIRDLVRSRGLGDVYKRQALVRAQHAQRVADVLREIADPASAARIARLFFDPVSYTHLTLPTSDLV